MCFRNVFSFAFFRHQAPETCRLVKRAFQVRESNTSKYMCQVCITLQICHVNLKLGFNSFNINVKWYWKYICCSLILAYFMKTGDEFLLNLNFFRVYEYLASMGFSILIIGKRAMFSDRSYSSHNWCFLSNAVFFLWTFHWPGESLL
jgi:hypothetical protein